MDQDEVPASPPSTSCHASILTQRFRRRQNQPAVRTENQEDFGDIAAEVANIYNADRQDSLQALRTRRQNRTMAATSEFICLEDLLRTQPDPPPGQEIVDMILRDFCSSPTYEEEEDLSTCETPPWFRFRKKMIRTYARKRAPAEREVLSSVAIEDVEEEEDDRLSCSSGLSVQEDHTTPMAAPATAVPELDANTSQKICENLLNLSQYFSLSNPSSSSLPNKDQPQAVSVEINLPAKVVPDSPKPSCSRDQCSRLSDTNSSAECTAIELENLEVDLLGIGFTFEASEVCDIKPQVPGNLGDTFFGDTKAGTTIVQSPSNSKVCVDWSEGDSLLENFQTEKMSLSDDEPEEKPSLIDQVKAEPIEVKSELSVDCTHILLDDIDISEWQTPMDIPEDSIEETKELPQKTVKLEPSGLIPQEKSQEVVEASTSKYKSDTDFLQNNPPDERQIMDIPEFVGFRTASDKPIEISKEMQERAAKLLADVEGMEPEKPKYEHELSEKPSGSLEFVGFKTASNKPIEITEEMESKGAMFIAQFKANDQLSQSNEDEFLQGIAFSEWQPIDMPDKSIKILEETKAEELNKSQQPETKTPNKSQSLNIPQLVAFRKTPYKFMEVAEEMRIKGDKLMAEVESGLYQPSQKRYTQNHEELPVTASKRHNEVSKELKMEAAEVEGVKSEFVGFRTASNKAIVVSEEMKARAAQFMAEFQTGGLHQEIESVVTDASTDNTEIIGFCTASDKPIVVSEEMKMKAAKLMAEVEAGGSKERVAGSTPKRHNEVSEEINKEAAEIKGVDSEFVGFRTASNKAIVVSEEMKSKAATFMAQFQTEESPQNINVREERVLGSRQPEETPEFFGFRTASNKRIEISEDMKNKAAKLMAEVQADSEVIIPNQRPTSDIECQSDKSENVSGESFKGFPENDVLPLAADDDLSNLSIFPRLSQITQNLSDCEDDSRVSTPRQRRDTSEGIPASKRPRQTANSSPEPNQQQGSLKLHKTTSCHSALGTPIQSQEIHASLSQLAGRSPLDQKTKTSVIARRNLLTLSKRRKRSRTPTGTGTGTGTPPKSRLAAMPTSTSTPLADRNMNHVKDSTTATKQSEEDMSPICMPPKKSRRLGLSKSRY